jgi:hypothetical protein
VIVQIARHQSADLFIVFDEKDLILAFHLFRRLPFASVISIEQMGHSIVSGFLQISIHGLERCLCDQPLAPLHARNNRNTGDKRLQQLGFIMPRKPQANGASDEFRPNGGGSPRPYL